jgi:two-component system response regulator AtoC
MPNALLVEDDKAALEALSILVEKQGFSTSTASTWADAKAELLRHAHDVVLLDVVLPGGSGIDLLLEIPKERRPQIVMMSGSDSVRKAFAGLPMQELHFVHKPIDVEALSFILRAVRRSCRRERGEIAETERSGPEILGDSVAMRRLRELVVRVSATDLPVYVEGESGTGKELVAMLVHATSSRRGKPFVAFNCGAVPETLIDSELFGHEKGAFTGADKAKAGLFEQAHGGTLFLDEIAEMPVDLQVRLLRTLENGRMRRVGGRDEIQVDVRTVAATNRRFDQAIAEGRFREDLFHRLCVFPIVTPPLREHREDIELLARRFLAEIESGSGRVKPLEPATLARLRAYGWPGNVRQLRNVIQRAYVMADSTITPDCLPVQVAVAAPSASVATADGEGRIELDVGTSLAEAERRLIEATLSDQSGDKRATAQILGVSLRTLYNRLKQYTGEEEPTSE